MSGTFDDPDSLVLENFSVDFVRHFSLSLNHVTLKRLGVHSTHTAESTFSIVAPERLANRLPLIRVFLRSTINWLVTRISSTLLV